ncbi:hypothetical protein BD310DRAFT_79715 [Dichomitus squalens]|uniref:DUF8212 domain-containing protein n=1 Tax=Dichomitus squalens TaxID=114155 RepID=A0A4Q9PJR0_9APHY|nr:hypothetical protein BD310DRAFT_79715 [Dichomitus squalens]
MYRWYRCAEVCYAHLWDVEDGDNPHITNSQFRRAEWFKRGWTLQELLAPNTVLFLSKTWAVIGTKHSLAKEIHDVTSIDTQILRGQRKLSDASVAERMSWASDRVTTKVEDRAYCLVGIFGVHLMPLYGEGLHAFIRLQEAILGVIPDQSIFAWGQRRDSLLLSEPSPSATALIASPGPLSDVDIRGQSWPYLLATSPKAFKGPIDISTISRAQLSERLGVDVEYPRYAITSYGMHMTLPTLPFSEDGSEGKELHLAFLACQDKEGRLLALILRRPRSPPSNSESIMHVGFCLPFQAQFRLSRPNLMASEIGDRYYRLAVLSQEQISACRTRILADRKVYVQHSLPLI